MDERSFFDGLLYTWFALAAVVFVALLFIPAPYGRYARGGFGPRLPFALGWVLMEAPAPLAFAAWYVLGDRPAQLTSIVFLVLWELHYLQRTFVYPALRRGRGQAIPLSVVVMAFVFNMGNAYLNGRWLFTLGPELQSSWLADPRFLCGVTLFLAGFAINLHADTVLLRLRRPGESGYRIPRGGLYRWVSCPNYLGEIVEWAGWAMLTWAVPPLAFALWTAANLAPRALSHHRWYQERFPDYPAERRALIPFVV